MTRKQTTERKFIGLTLEEKRLGEEPPAGQLLAMGGTIWAVFPHGLFSGLFCNEADV
jgi:hypothetical protein